MKKYSALLLVLALCLMIAGCGGSSDSGKESSVTEIVLKGGSAEVKGGGAKAEGSVVTISSVGTYSVGGKLDSGMIVVDTGEDAMEVTLILNNAEISNPDGPAIHVAQAKDLKIELAAGSVNKLTSGTEKPLGQADANASGAALYAEDDMDIDGADDSVLNVYGYINNGIACKNDLDIKGGTINVVAVNNGVRGSDSFEMKGGTLNVQAGNDGIKSTTADKDGKGYIDIQAGEINVSSVGDGISAETELSVNGGIITVSTTGDPEQLSSKGIKANTALTVNGGEISVESEDHALQCNGAVSLKGGALSLVSYNGKGVGSDADINVDGGTVKVNSMEDGIETLGNITINGGEINIVSGKDGLQAGEANSGKGDVTIKGGKVFLNAYKSGVNARGKLRAEGGTLMALCGEAKQMNNCEGCAQAAFAGAKGANVSISAGGKVLAEQKAAWSFKALVFAFSDNAAGTYTISDGMNSVEIAP